MANASRTFQTLLIASVMLTSAHVIAADVYPTRNARLIIPFAPGGTNDALARMNIIQYQAHVIELIRSGRLRALAVTTGGKRVKSLPEVPSMNEAGLAGMTIYTWAGLVGPAQLPAAVTGSLQTEIARILTLPAVRDRFAGHDVEMIGSRPEEFAKLIRNETRLWGEVIRSAGIVPQ